MGSGMSKRDKRTGELFFGGGALGAMVGFALGGVVLGLFLGLLFGLALAAFENWKEVRK
jgi:small-conductance mechanosensitive channel